MKQIIVSILLLIPLLGFGQEDSEKFKMPIMLEADSVHVYFMDTLRFERIYTFDFYEQLPCTVYTAQEELFCYALMKTTFYRYGESGEWAAEGRWFVNFIDGNDDVVFFEPGEVLFVHLQTRRQ